MDLTDLPLELLQAIMTETVWLVGLHQAIHLRLVSKMFDTQVQRAIYALPTFDSTDRHLLPLALCCPRRMHPSMTTRLILSKMNAKDSEKRPLCLAITRTVAHLDNHLEHKEADSRRKFIEALAGAAARALELHDIANCLVTTPTVLLDKLERGRENKFELFRRKHPGKELPRYPIDYLTPSSASYIDSAPQDALIAALSTKHFQLAKRLLEGGVKATTKSPAFGLPLQVAAFMGAQELVQMILDGLLSEQGKEDDVDSAGTMKGARRSVLQGAAAGGHEHIVQQMLDDLKNSNVKRSGTGLSRPIKAAVENGHEHVALLLLQHRTPVPLREPAKDASSLGRYELRFWRDLSQRAERYGCKSVLRIALESAIPLSRESDRSSETEDA